MILLLLTKYLHICLAVLSLVKFLILGVGYRLRQREPESWLLHVGMAMDGGLLLSGVLLWWLMALSPFQESWFLVKLIALLAYIGVANYVLRLASGTAAKLAGFLATIALWFYIVGVSGLHSPYGWFSLP